MKITLNVSPDSTQDINISLDSATSSTTSVTHGVSSMSLSEATAKRASSRKPWKPDEVYEPLPPPKGDIKALPWGSEYTAPILFINANLVDVTSALVHSAQSVLIKDGLVASVKATSAADLIGLEEGTRVVDLDGLWLSPGLIDCHVHINMSDGFYGGAYVDPHLRATYTLKKFLSRGFTTVRDVGGATLYQKQATETWLTPGPRIFQGGDVLSQTGGHGDSRLPYQDDGCCTGGVSALVDGVPAALQAARNTMRKGADHIKICTSGGVSSPTDALESLQFTAEEISAITSVCKAMGGRMVTAHCYTPEGIKLAVENGVGCIEHGNLMDKESAELMARKGIFFTPTLMISQAKGRAPWNALIPEHMRPKNAMVRDAGLRAIKIADEAGVTICFGTDLTIGMGYLQSEEFTVRRTIVSDAKVLAHATINAAKNLGYEGKLGCICPGSFGDMIILAANPLEDVRVLDTGARGLLGVVKDGKIVIARGEFKEMVGAVDVELGLDE